MKMESELESFMNSSQPHTTTDSMSDARSNLSATTGEEVLYDLLFHDSLKTQKSASHKVKTSNYNRPFHLKNVFNFN
jgi:hypothetical protein